MRPLRFSIRAVRKPRSRAASPVRVAVALTVGAAAAMAAMPAGAIVVSIGHRGASALAPENTIASVEAAYGHAWGVECDPRITADGQFVLMHDSTAKRTTGVDRSVESMTLAEVRALDAGSWFSPLFAGEKVPTLQEELAAALAGGLVPCLDIKSGTPAQYLPVIQPYKNQIEVHSFDWDDPGNFIEGLNALDGGFTLVALGTGDLASRVAALPACVDKVSWVYSGISAMGVSMAHAVGKQVYAWTVDDAATMLSLEAMGVDGIVTNNPALATAVLNQPTPPVPRLGDGLPRKLHDGLAMSWSFDDALGGGAPTTAVDAVSGANAALAPTMAVPGSWQTVPNAKLGGALSFDGANDYAAVPTDPETAPQGNAVSVAAWVKLDTLPSAMGLSYGSIYDSSGDAYVLYCDKGANELRFKVTATAVAKPGIPGAQLDTTSWHQIVGVYDGGAGVARIYLDGNLVDVHADESAGSDGLTGLVALQSAFFGCNGTATNGYFDGKIDETAVWSRALGKGEIAYLYNGGAGRAVLEGNPTVEAVAPVVRLEFEGNLTNQGSAGATYNGQWIDSASGQHAYEAGMNGQSLHLHNPESPTDGDAVSIPVTLGNSGTISFWCRPDSFYDSQTLFDNSSNGNDWEMGISAAGVAEFRIESGSEVSCNLNLLDGPDEWYHMAVTWFKAGSDVVMNLYVDGLLRDVDEGAWVAPGGTVYLGSGNPADNFANAVFDDFRIYDTMLSTDEIVGIFVHREAGGIPEIPGDATRDGVVNELDAQRLAGFWGQTDAQWYMGDFNGDAVVDAADAAILASNWGTQYTESAGTVPEPAVHITVLAALLVGAAMRRRRRGHSTFSPLAPCEGHGDGEAKK